MARREGGLGPALVGSLAIHAAVVAALLVSLPKTRKALTVGAVPVTIVSSLPQAAPAPAPEVAEPAAEDVPPPPAPEPELAPQPTPPPPAPPPPKKAVTPAPVPPPKKAPTPPAKTPAQKTPPAKQEDALDLAALQKSLTRARPSSAAPITNSRSVRPAAGAAGPPASAVNALAGQIQDNWILNNCDVAVAEGIEVTVTFSLSGAGRISRGPELKNRRADPVWGAAARSALAAVRAGDPYDDLPRELFNQDYEFNFKAADACRGR